MTEKVLRHRTVECPYLECEIDVLCTYAVVRAIGGISGEKFLSFDCNYSDECTCDCPLERRRPE